MTNNKEENMHKIRLINYVAKISKKFIRYKKVYIYNYFCKTSFAAHFKAR